MKGTFYKITFGLINKIFTELLIDIVSASNHTKCVLLSNQKCMTQPTLINLQPNEYSQDFYYYPFAVKLYRCVESFNTLNNLSNKICVPKKKNRRLNLSMFTIESILLNESKALTKHISCECKCRFFGR